MEKYVPAVARRNIVFSIIAFTAVVTSAHAQTYPSRPVRFITASAPGGNADILTRILAEGLAKNLGQPFVVDNRPGGSSTIGTLAAAKAPPDGYTILMVSSSHSVNPSLFGKDLPYDTQGAFDGVGQVGSTPIILVANPGVGVSTLKELIAKAKAAPGEINFSSNGNGSPAHLAGELLNTLAGIKTTHIPYRGTPQSVNDTVSGQVHLAYPSLPSVSAMIKSGKLRALGITSSKRSSAAREIPAMAETVPGYQASIWTGVVAPAGVPKPIIAKLNVEIIKVLRTPEVKAKLENVGVDIETSTPEEFDAFIDAEIKKWARVIKQGNIKVEMQR